MVESSLKKAEKVTLKSSFIIIVLSGVKAIVGLLSGSLVLLTDALHSFTDLLTNFVSWAGLRIAQRKPDEKFPYGYFKAENLSALFISVFVIYLAVQLFIEGLSILSETPSLKHPIITIIVAVSSIFASYLLSKYLINNGRRINSKSLIANGKEKRVDVLTSGVVLAAIILSYLQVIYVEGIITIIISIIILKEGLELTKDSVFSLMDMSPSKGKEQEIIRVISEIPGVEGYGNLKLRMSGPFIFGEVDVMIRKQVNVDLARKLCTKIEDEAKKRINDLNTLKISIIPYKPETIKLAVPIKSKKENSEIMSKFGRANYFLFLTITGSAIKKREFVINKFKTRKYKSGFYSARFIVNKKIDAVIVKEIGEIAYHTLKSNVINIYATNKKNVDQIIKDFMNDKLENLEK